MALIVDKQRPTSLDAMDYHTDQAQALKKLAASDDFPHLLFYGPSGAGKKTRIMALLRQIYGSSVDNLKLEQRQVKLPNKSDSIEITVVGSSHHIEINPSESGFYDRVVVQDVIKDIAQNQAIDTGTAGARRFKVVVINEADGLSREAQHGLRRTMEKYMAQCRLILTANSLSKVIEAVRSRCLCLRISAPDHASIVKIIDKAAKADGFTVPPNVSNEIVVKSGRNLRRALLMLEATKVAAYPIGPNQAVQVPDWEIFVSQIAGLIHQAQQPAILATVRAKLYELITHNIPPDMILKKLTFALLDKVPTSAMTQEFATEILHWASVFDHRQQLGSKPIFHLEAFVAKFLELWKAELVKLVS